MKAQLWFTLSAACILAIVGCSRGGNTGSSSTTVSADPPLFSGSTGGSSSCSGSYCSDGSDDLNGSTEAMKCQLFAENAQKTVRQNEDGSFMDSPDFLLTVSMTTDHQAYVKSIDVIPSVSGSYMAPSGLITKGEQRDLFVAPHLDGIHNITVTLQDFEDASATAQCSTAIKLQIIPFESPVPPEVDELVVSPSIVASGEIINIKMVANEASTMSVQIDNETEQPLTPPMEETQYQAFKTGLHQVVARATNSGNISQMMKYFTVNPACDLQVAQTQAIRAGSPLTYLAQIKGDIVGGVVRVNGIPVQNIAAGTYLEALPLTVVPTSSGKIVLSLELTGAGNTHGSCSSDTYINNPQVKITVNGYENNFTKKPGADIVIKWEGKDVTSCRVEPIGKTGKKGSVTIKSSSITISTTYTVSCVSDFGTISASIRVKVDGQWFPTKGGNCLSVCALKGLRSALSPDLHFCASGELIPRSLPGNISFPYGCWKNCTPHGYALGRSIGDKCYGSGQKQDCDRTDTTIACYCK